MITTKQIKIKKVNDFSGQYIENILQKTEYDILRWAITDHDEEYYTLDISIVVN